MANDDRGRMVERQIPARGITDAPSPRRGRSCLAELGAHVPSIEWIERSTSSTQA